MYTIWAQSHSNSQYTWVENFVLQTLTIVLLFTPRFLVWLSKNYNIMFLVVCTYIYAVVGNKCGHIIQGRRNLFHNKPNSSEHNSNANISETFPQTTIRRVIRIFDENSSPTFFYRSLRFMCKNYYCNNCVTVADVEQTILWNAYTLFIQCP